METFKNYTEAKIAADNFFNENFDQTQGASSLTERSFDVVCNDDGEEVSRKMEFFSLEDPGMVDTFICSIENS